MAESPMRVPPEVPRYFADKGLRPAFSWLDVWGQEHAYAFTVAKAVETELLSTFKQSIQRAIEGGQGFETWRAGLRPELERLGWWGKRLVADSTGQDPDRAVDFSSTGRLQRIFSTNMRSARAAGQWERIQRTKGALPYLLYVRTTSYRPRPQHLAWAGTILPADDPWWSTHFPPNGWNCKCAVRQVSSLEREQKIAEGGYSDEAPPLVERTHVNRRTGEVTRVPEGIDPGFGHNAGLARAQTLTTRLQAELETAGPAIARTKVAELMATPAPRIIMGVPQKVTLPVAVAEAAAASLHARSPLLVVANDTMRAKAGKHAAVSAETFGLAQRIMDGGLLVDEGRDQGRSRTIFAEVDGAWWELVVTRSTAGYMRIKTLHRSDRRKRDRAQRS